MQADYGGKALPYFGNLNYESVTLLEIKKKVLWLQTQQKPEEPMYNFSNPVFVQNQLYNFNVRAFEQYPFYEDIVDGVPVIKQVRR